MPEFRQDLATKQWIIIAAERARRPEDFARTRPPVDELPPWSASCPFCAGNEDQTPPALLTIPVADDPWAVRVVPNRFPALSAHYGEPCMHCSTAVGPYLRRHGVGFHEVVIETPRHNEDLPFLPHDHMEAVVQAYCQRYASLVCEPAAEMVLIFRNHGQRAGTSLIHPHSQIVGSSVVPFPVRNRLYEGQRYYDERGRCVYCDMIDYELREGTRVVMDNSHFVALAPYASSVPYEIQLLPKRHSATFGTASADELHDLAVVLQDLLARLWRLLDDPDYNFVIDTAPEHLEGVPSYHWHLEIYPKLTTQAGFEIGSGIGINIVEPERAAAQLREVNGVRIEVGERKNDG
jgi:UDPglucose--hexose-1-phosphate uridylyltransferase